MKRYERLVRLDTCLEIMGRKRAEQKKKKTEWKTQLNKRRRKDGQSERRIEKNHNSYIANKCRSIAFGTVNSIHYRSSLRSRGEIPYNLLLLFLLFGPFSQWSCEEHFNQMGTLTVEEEADWPASRPTNQPVYYVFISFEFFLST